MMLCSSDRGTSIIDNHHLAIIGLSYTASSNKLDILVCHLTSSKLQLLIEINGAITPYQLELTLSYQCTMTQSEQ